MDGELIAADAAAFLRCCVTSPGDLEVLVVLMSFRDRWFDTAAVGSEAGLTPGQARRALDRFVSANLVDVRVTDLVRYQFHPGNEQLEAGARAVCELYRRHPPTLVRWLERQSLRRLMS